MLDDRYITWNGKTSLELGLWVKKVPALNRPARKHSRYSVPQKNGDEFMLDGAWENYIQEYVFFIKNDDGNVDIPTKAAEIAEWLHNENATGYQELRDSLEPDYFRLAVVVSPINITNNLEQFGEVKVQFNCRPERFLESGNVWIENVSETFVNPTKFRSYPIIKLYGTETNGRSLFKWWNRNTNSTNAYDMQDVNSYIRWGEYPTHQPPVKQQAMTGTTININEARIRTTNTSNVFQRYAFPIRLKDNTMYRMKWDNSFTNTDYISIVFYGNDRRTGEIELKNINQAVSFSVPEYTKCILLFINIYPGNTSEFKNIQLSYANNKPFNYVKGDDAKTITVAGDSTFYVYVDDVMYIDGETLRTYDDNNKDLLPVIDDFNTLQVKTKPITLRSGNIWITNSVERIDILPRWWTL